MPVPNAKWQPGTGKQVILKSDMLAFEEAILTGSPVNGIYFNTGGNPATELGYGTWQSMDEYQDPDPALILHFEGSGSTFADNSKYNHTVSPQNDATQSVTQYKLGTKALYCDGVGDYLTIPNHQCFQFRTGDFSIELWAYMTDITGTRSFLASGSGGFAFYWNAASGILDTYLAGVRNYVSWAPLVDTWYHLGFYRHGGMYSMFVDGTQINITTVSTDDIISADSLYIARDYLNQFHFKGYMDEIVIRKGMAAHTCNFTPPTVPFVDTYQWVRLT